MSDTTCPHDSQDGFRTGSASGWLCLQCERVVEWTPIDDGFRVVPTDLVENARSVVNTVVDVRGGELDALAASLAAYDGNDPLTVFEGKP